jgi:diguanylate cyclase (GGDEF)-like protein
MQNIKAYRILIVHASLTQAEAMADAMRKYQLIVESQFIENTAAFLDALEQSQWHLILFAPSNANINTEQFWRIQQELAANTPVICLLDDYDRGQAMSLLEHGASDVIGESEHKWLAQRIDQLATLRDSSINTEIEKHRADDNATSFITLFSMSPAPLCLLNNGVIEKANTAFVDFFAELSGTELENTAVLELVERGSRKTLKKVLNQVQEKRTQPEALQVAIKDKGDIELYVRPVTLNNEPLVLMSFQVHAAPSPANAAIEHGLINTEFFMQELNHRVQLGKTDNQAAGLFIIELNNFTSVKQNVGFKGSDSALLDLTDFILNSVDKRAIVCRISGDAFAVLTPIDSDEQFTQSIEDLKQRIAEYVIVVNNQSISVTASIGAAIIKGQFITADLAFSQADIACKIADKLGGNHAHVYDPEKDRSTSEKLDQNWAIRIRAAIENDDFTLAFQPIVSLHAQPGKRFEVLLRLQSKQGEPILPDQFMHTAKQAHLEGKIDRWVIAHAIGKLSTHANEVDQLFIKLSEATIRDATFIDWLTTAIGDHQLAQSQLVFEVEETHFINLLPETRALATGLNKLNCAVAITSFSGDENCMRNIQQVSFDYIILNGLLVRDVATDRHHQMLLKEVCETARSLDKEIIAPFVQNADTLAHLWSEGVNFIQGYYLQGPSGSLDYDFSDEI